jgi:hypothetical protein
VVVKNGDGKYVLMTLALPLVERTAAEHWTSQLITTGIDNPRGIVLGQMDQFLLQCLAEKQRIWKLPLGAKKVCNVLDPRVVFPRWKWVSTVQLCFGSPQ